MLLECGEKKGRKKRKKKKEKKREKKGGKKKKKGKIEKGGLVVGLCLRDFLGFS